MMRGWWEQDKAMAAFLGVSLVIVVVLFAYVLGVDAGMW